MSQPYKVDTDVGLPRGEQIGYNICNSTTEGPQSLCQTLIINSLDGQSGVFLSSRYVRSPFHSKC
jgi:hypothetical protein